MDDQAVEAKQGVEDVERGVTRTADHRRTCGKVIHAPEETLEFAVLCLLSEGHLIIEDFPGVGKTTLAKSLARSVELLVLAAPVHARPAPVGRHRRQRLQPALERVRVPAGPRVRQHPARRRDQPRVAEDAVGPPRVHAGAPGDGRRRLLPARAAVHGHGDPEPDRVRGDVPAPRGRARPLHDADRDRLPAARGRGAHALRERSRDPARRAGVGRDRTRRSSARSTTRAASSSRTASTATSSHSCATRARTRASSSARARARASRSCAWPRRGRSSRRATSWSPTTSRRSPRPCSPTG